MIKFGLLIIFVVVLNSINGDDLCSLCKCKNQLLESKVNISLTVIKCDGQNKKILDTLTDLKELIWPNHQNTTYFVKFTNLNIYYLPEILGSPDVIGMDLTNSSIRNVDANPFKNFPNLQEITLRNNKLFGVEEWFENNKNLTYLSLANTSLSELRPHCVSHLEHLYELDLSHNFIIKLSSEFFESIQSVQYLHVNHNKIYFIESLNTITATKGKSAQLRFLDLSYNKLSVITTHQFENLINLETLILKSNQITNVDSNSFMNLHRIKLIDLSFNSLTEINSFKNTNSIEILHLNNNQINNWNLIEIPTQLTELYVQSNNINSFSGDNFDNLKIFNISHNSLNVLPNIKFERLEILDVSYNSLTATPQGMSDRTPLLDTLILDNNPISLIQFVDRVKLRRLSLNDMPLIKTIDYDTFKNIEETGTHSNGDIMCMELEMSNCPYLSEIEENALSHVNLCKLDLSYNKLKTLPENLTNWSVIEKGINLQGNPFNCDCTQQWILDIIVDQLFKNKTHQYLLRELRCNEPKLFANKRFIKFYRRGDIFCQSGSAQTLAQLRKIDEDDRVETAGFSVNLNLKQRPSYITIIVSCIVLLLVMIGFGLHCTNQQRKKLANNRRFT